MTLREIREALVRHGLRPLAQFGQNFLYDENLCRLIAAALPSHGSNRVVEIGPGLGAVTEFLLAGGWAVEAIEIDRGLAAAVEERLGGRGGFRLHRGDALELLPGFQPIARLMGNLPYNVTTPLVVTALAARAPDFAGVFLVQKEVAARLAAQPRSKEWGALSALVQTACVVERLRDVEGHLFYPAPAVASTVVRLVARTKSAIRLEEEADFYRFVRRGFAQRRKKLKHVLPVRSEARAEELSLEEWHRLYAELGRMVRCGG